MKRNTAIASVAYARGYTPIPIDDNAKVPRVQGWQKMHWDSEEQLVEAFDDWGENGKSNVAVLLGKPSSNLTDVDIDHPKADRLRDYFLPATPAMSGRASRRRSHYWYIVVPSDEGKFPGTRQHLMPRTEDGKRGEVTIEYRSTGAQTVLPGSIHPSGEAYEWDERYGPWGGEDGPAVVNAQVLAVQVALVGLGAVLIDNWPSQGTRHEAYVALAGALLSYGDGEVHPFWERNASVLIRAIADATLDDDGPDSREAESIGSTIKAIREGKHVVGFGKLAEILGQRYVDQIKLLVAEVESLAGFVSRQALSAAPAPAPAPPLAVPENDGEGRYDEDERADQLASTPLEERDPLSERVSSWGAVDLYPYLSGQIVPVEPSVLQRDDGQCLMYPGRINMLFGSSESAKTWIALQACIQAMTMGERVVYLDFEDEPVNTLYRLQLLGATHEEIDKQFTYIRPEEPLAAMQRNRWGGAETTEVGLANEAKFLETLDTVDPTLIIADGMTVLYSLHGLDTNSSAQTEVITGWMKRLARNGRSTVIVIDHSAKGSERGSLPIGSQHKQSMVMGTLLQVWPVKQPMPGVVGRIEVIVLKDRPGQVRKIAAQSSGTGKVQVAAIVEMDSTQEGETIMRIIPPVDQSSPEAQGKIDLGDSRAAQLARARQEAEQRVLHAYGGVNGRTKSLRDLRGELPDLKDKTLTNAVRRLTEKGWLQRNGETKGVTYSLEVGGAGYEIEDPDTTDTTVDFEVQSAEPPKSESPF